MGADALEFNPLRLDNRQAYQRWRSDKLRAYEAKPRHQPLLLPDGEITAEYYAQIIQSCAAANLCLYRLPSSCDAGKGFVKTLGRNIGLNRLDGNLCSDEDNISSIQVMGEGRQTGYIPYTDRQLTWHTDGYYNDVSRTIRAMILHCVRPAKQGGENLLLDHELAYIQLRDESEAYIEAFTQPEVLTIPPNIENGQEIRGAVTGPVFSLDVSGRLHMRYSARSRNIEWRADAQTQEAVACMKQLLEPNNPYVITYRMQAGEGIIANNILHNRTAFEDAEAPSEQRLLYRARYYDRVQSEESE